MNKIKQIIGLIVMVIIIILLSKSIIDTPTEIQQTSSICTTPKYKFCEMHPIEN